MNFRTLLYIGADVIYLGKAKIVSTSKIKAKTFRKNKSHLT